MKMVRWTAALLLVGGPSLALLFKAWGVGSLAFGFGAILLGVAQIRSGESRSDRFIGWTLVLGGAATVIDGLVRLLLRAGL